MDASSAVPMDDSGFAGSTVAEQLQTLRVACEGSSDATAAAPRGPALKEGDEQVPLSPERLCGKAPAKPSGLPREPEPPWVGLKGSPAAEEKPAALGDGNGNGRTSPGMSGEQACPPVEAPQAVAAASEKEDDRPPSEEVKVDPQSSSSAFQGGHSEQNGGLSRQTAAVGVEDALSKENPAALRREKGAGSTKGGGTLESDSDTDADSSSSLSSPPLLSDGDDQQDKNENNSSATKKSELTKQEPLSVEDVMIILPESVKLMPFGKVSSIIEHLVIIESEKGLPPVNENTVLFKEDRHSLGKIFEIFGPVSHPFYVVQFNSPEHIQSKDIKIKDAVCFAPAVESFTQYIFPEKLKQEKGSDASWKNDEEPPLEALDFSDDEKEKAAKLHKKSQNIKRKKLRSQQNDSKDNGPNYQSRRQPPSEYSGGYCRGQPTTRFSWGRSPPVTPFPRPYRQHNITPPYYSSDYAHLQKAPTFCQQQRLESMRRHQYSFPPPSFETVGNNTNFPPPPPPVDWGWPPTCPQNTYEPLLSMLSLPPPPPPPLPPPSTAPNIRNSP
ncbi:H/ACA ribonucleoprotein complex non-core subunit NAF1 [Protobothrops mucrosquamatus]|uniref:H/ACA ribonucleoprotein complex non-core subunit NAF1 n=1 Tax=Protobothrops mucrosquamatus TaxID=103944 RepID=UPI000775F323|nr:H/ACA ribonucleoprotein complex non-core subunit NAF1 [Protobothrops mucrosquamatus]